MDDFDDLLGTSERPLRVSEDSFTSLTAAERALKGANRQWFAKLLGMSLSQVTRKLANVHPVQVSRLGTAYYDPREALPYLVMPHDLTQIIKEMNPKDLPPKLRTEFWNAKLKEQDYRYRAGELWDSESVIAVFGEVFKLIKNRTRLWQNSVHDTAPLTDAQREALVRLSEDLLLKVYEAIIALESGKATPSQLGDEDYDGEEEGD